MIPHDPLDLALSHLNSGRAQEAAGVLRKVLDRDPAHAEAIHLLGVIALQSGAIAEALALLARAAERAPRVAMVWSNLGVANAAAGDYAAALRCHEKAQRLDPGNATPLKNRAVALRHLGRAEEALASARLAVARAPQDPEALRVAGEALVDLGRPAEALPHFDRAVALAPADAMTRHNRGTAHYRNGDPERAAADYREAVALSPNFAKAHDSLGLVLNDLGRPDEAVGWVERAVFLAPQDPDPLVNLGLSLDQVGRSEEAVGHFEAALALAPGHAGAMAHLAVALLALGRDVDAREACRRATQLDPHFASTLVHRLHLRLKLCDWRGLQGLAEWIREQIRSGAPCPPFALLHIPATPALQRQCAERFARDLPKPVALPATRGTRDRVRIGYFSADFREHPVAHLMAPVIELHDRRRFEVFTFSFGPNTSDPLRDRIRAASDCFEDVHGASAAEIALLARRRGIDIAIDLVGYTEHARPEIFARRAAPIQAQYLGFPGTMGMVAIDYLVADATVVPEEHAVDYAEKIVFMPGSYMPNDAGRPIDAHVPSRDELGLPPGVPVFCCFNHRLKFSPESFASWMRILGRVEGSVLWLAKGGELAERNLRGAARSLGVAPERLVFAPRLPLSRQHLARVRAADIALDTFPYNGHATTSDCLLAGVPVVAQLGGTFASRVAASLLRATGLQDLVTASTHDYEALAVDLATRPAALADVRARVARSRETSSLFDAGRFTRELESAFAAMWERHRAGLPPASLRIAPSP